MTAEREPYLDVADIAAWLKLAESTVRDHAAKGVIPATKVHGEWRFLASRVQAWLDTNDNQRIRLVVTPPNCRKPEPTTGRRLTGRRVAR